MLTIRVTDDEHARLLERCEGKQLAVCHAVESAGAALERADRTLEPVIQREQEIRDERLIQEREHELSLERERQLEIQERTLDGPSLGW
ncbi:mobilization protein [Escherichia coli O45:H11]|uniref:mobilization protein n=1 Tax=Escherichia coli TaxID=562 RepID=UPI000BDEDBD9|nr:mobilization protein [Escherichia coli O45:H11]HAI2204345.1 mobilization protein [Escherichia coli]